MDRRGGSKGCSVLRGFAVETAHPPSQCDVGLD